ncbi:MAG: leucine-rich repeat protein [Clostridia bacterium]|nr:leucine-rich repeat protein [Clostridia bacterium]
MEVEETTPERYDIPGVYYASENEDSGASQAPLTAKAGSIYVGSGSSFTMSQGAIRSHSAEYGGAIYVANGGTFTMTGGVIAYNQAKWGGAIYVEAGGTCHLLGGSITGNASEEATAVYVEDGGTLVVDGCNIVNNYTQLYGNYIDFYVDGVLARSVSLGNSTTFNLSDAPLPYTECCGYFKEEILLTGIEDGEALAPVAQSAVASNQNFAIYNLYTKTATPELIDNTICGGELVYLTNAKTNIVVPRQFVDGELYTCHQVECDSLYCDSLTLPSSLRTVGFYDTKIENDLVLPDSVTEIYNTAALMVYNPNKLIMSLVTYNGSWSYTNTLTCFVNNVSVIGNGTLNRSSFVTGGVQIYDVNLELIGDINISSSAFEGFSGLAQVTTSGNVTIGSRAFFGTGLYSVTLGSGVTEIGEKAFYNCSNLTTLTLPDTLTTIHSSAFEGCTGLENLILPNRLVTIDGAAFARCESLTDVVIPDSVTSLGNTVFYRCFDLETVRIGSGVTNIGSYLFYQCSELESVTWSNSITSIGYVAFYGCTSLSNISLPTSLVTIGESAFNSCTGLTSITIPNSVETIGKDAFHNCTLTRINFGAGIESIGNNAFRTKDDGTGPAISLYYSGSLNDYLTNISFGNYWILADWTLYINNTAVTNLAFPNGITEIPDWAFYFNSGLTSVTLSDNITSIGARAIMRCSSLETVTIGAGVQTIGDRVFDECSGLTQFTVDENNTVYASQDGILYNKAKTSIIQVPQGITGSVTLPSTLTRIGSDAFYECTGLTSITIPASVTSIGERAFDACYRLVEVYNLSSLTITAGSSDNGYAGYRAKVINTSADIPSRLTTINNVIYYKESETDYIAVGLADSGIANITLDSRCKEINQHAFYDCSGLTSVTIPDSVTSIGSSAFYNCTRLTSITIPSSVTSIGAGAFKLTDYAKQQDPNWTGLKTIAIPNGVTSIGSEAFKGQMILEIVNLSAITMEKGSSENGYIAKYAVVISDDFSHVFHSWSEIESNNIKYFKSSDSSYKIAYGIVDPSATVYAFDNDCTDIINPFSFEGCTEITSISVSDVTLLKGIVIPGDCVIQNTLLNSFSALKDITGPILSQEYLPTSSSVINLNINKDGVEIPTRAFFQCDKLVSVEISGSIAIINQESFTYVYNMTTFIISGASENYDSLVSWNAHMNSLLTKVVINGEVINGSNVLQLGSGMFYNDPNIEEITVILPENKNRISVNFANIFNQCSNLTVTFIGHEIASVPDSSGHLTGKASVIYVNEDAICPDGITGFTLQSESDKAGYKKYVKNS